MDARKQGCSAVARHPPLQVAALAPKIEALEASWNRLRAISGGETPEQVVAYWDGELRLAAAP